MADNKPEYHEGDLVLLLPAPLSIEEIRQQEEGDPHSQILYKLSNGSWYFDDEIIPY